MLLFVLVAPLSAGEALPAPRTPPAPTHATGTNTVESLDDEPVDLDAEDLGTGAGSLSPRVIGEVVKKNTWQVNECYNRHAVSGQVGRIAVEFEIGAEGTVTRSRAKESNLANPVLQDCILATVKRWKFPVPDGGTVVTTHPFVFG